MLEHKTVSLADQVFERLEKDILTGVYSKGEILTENKLCEILGVSRTPIREALRRLEQDHLIKETGKGVCVLGITEEDLKDIFIIRENLEGICAKLAAKKCSEKQLKDLEAVLELQEFYVNKHNAEQIKVMDNQFHETLYKLSGSIVFYNTLLPLLKKVQKYRKANVQSKIRANESVAEHKKILEFIKLGDAENAANFTAQHIRNAYNYITGE